MEILRKHGNLFAGVAGALALVWGVAHAAQSGGVATPGPKEIAQAAKPLGSPAPTAARVGAPGVVEPRDREVKVAPQVAGVVQAVHVQEGSMVHAGDPLVQLYAANEAAAVQAAQAEVEGAQAQLQKAQRGARREDVDAALADADAADARAESSNDTLQRTEKLFAKGAATVDEMTRARFAATADGHSAAAARARHQVLANGSRAEDVAAAKATLAQAAARLLQTQVTLDRLTVRAPGDGEVLQVLVRAGEYINPAAGGAVTLGDTRSLRVRLDVDERDVARVSPGQAAVVRAEGYGSETFAGTVVQVGKRMGRKNVRTDEPTERLDTKILEVAVELTGHPALPQGLRVTGFLGETR